MRDYVNLDKSERNSGKDSKWRNLVPLVKKVNAYSDKIDVWRLAVYIRGHGKVN